MQGILLLDIVVDNLTTLNGLNAFLIGGFVLLCVGYWLTNGTNVSGYNTAVRPSRAPRSSHQWRISRTPPTMLR